MKQHSFQSTFVLSWFFFFLIVGEVNGQDIHYSMFNRSPMNLSPALIGVFGGDLRVTANYRSQWTSVPVSYKTFTATVEHKFFPKKDKNGFFTGGLFFNYDDAGDLSLATNQLGLSGAYLQALAPKHYLSGGIHLGFLARNFNTNNIRVDLQFDGEGFNSNLPHGEDALLDGQNEGNVSFASFSGGLNYRYQNTDNKRTRVDIGGAIYHFNKRDNNFKENEVGKLDSRISLYGISSFKLLPLIDLGFLISGQFQGPHNEVVLGGNSRFYFENKKGQPMSLLFGLAYRVDDAIIPNINFDYRNFSFGFSYDINTSRFDIATNSKGGPEFSVIYTVAKVRPLTEHRICPIF